MRLPTEAEIRAEADGLLSSGLRETLESYGEVHVVGSYRMRLMAWHDLDVHLVREAVDKTAFFALGGRVASLLSAQRMHYRDETVAATPGLPSGLYWGVYLGDERKGAWKIDIWATGPAGLDRVGSYCDAIARRLSSSSRETILQIKSECWQHPEYRRAFSSADIYTAVLEHGIEDVDEFWTFLERQGHLISTLKCNNERHRA